jgi:hypothetical protein
MRFAIILWLFLLTGCSGTGGALGNLVPAPKFLNGNIDGSLYVAPDKAFSVRLPYSPTGSHMERSEWRYAKVHEISDGPVVGVIFGPAALDLNLYHAVLIREPRSGDKDASTDDLFARKLSFREGSYQERSRQMVQINGRTSYYAVYESQDAYLVLSVTDSPDSYYVVEADISKHSVHNLPSDAQSLIDRSWPVFNVLLESFTTGSSN